MSTVDKVKETVTILRVNALRLPDVDLSTRCDKLASELTELLYDIRKKYEVPNN